MNFGKSLKLLLEEREMSQIELALAIGYTQRAVSKWVNEQSEPSESAIKKVSDFFGVSTDYLLGRSDDLGNVVIRSENNFDTSPLEQRLILDFRKLPAETQDNFVELFHNLAVGA